MLAGKILSIDKKFILVRAKIDQDIYNARHDEMHLYYESSTLQKIRNDCSGTSNILWFLHNKRNYAGRQQTTLTYWEVGSFISVAWTNNFDKA